MNDDTQFIHIRLPKRLLKRLDHRVVEASDYGHRAVGRRLLTARGPIVEALLTRVLDAIDRGEVVL